MTDYSLLDCLKTGIDLLLTKLLFPKARLIRRPFYLRGKKGIQYGPGLTTGHGCRFDASNKEVTLLIGQNARFGDYVHINADKSVIIGKNILTASKVLISDTNHGSFNGDNQTTPYSNPSEWENTYAPVRIGDNVWIGENAVILPGTIIGDGCVVGANTLVNGGEFQNNCIIVGSPARAVKQYQKESGKWEKLR